MAHPGKGALTVSPSAVFEREHHAIDSGIGAFADGSGGRDHDTLAAALHMLRRHIYAEEELMFPPLREAGLVGPVLVMLREHAKMWLLLDALEDLLAAGEIDPAALRGNCAQLFELLQRHNPKEEAILYPQADTLLGEGDVSRLVEFLTSDDLPDGWSCQGMRR